MSTHSTNIDVYHGSPNDFNHFKPGKKEALGIHVGTKKQAAGMATHRSDGQDYYVYHLNIELSGPLLRLKDLELWTPTLIINQIEDLGYLINHDEIPMSAKEMRAYIESLGFSGVVYLNRHEGYPIRSESRESHRYQVLTLTDEAWLKKYPKAEDSFIVFHPKKISIVECEKICFMKNDTVKKKIGIS